MSCLAIDLFGKIERLLVGLLRLVVVVGIEIDIARSGEPRHLVAVSSDLTARASWLRETSQGLSPIRRACNMPTLRYPSAT